MKVTDGPLVEVRAPQFISSIGSTPAPIDDIPMNGELYDYQDWDVGRLEPFPTLFSAGNVVTGKGNIVDSRRHAKKVAAHVSDEYFQIAEDVKKLKPLSAQAREALLERVTARKREIDYLDYDSWIEFSETTRVPVVANRLGSETSVYLRQHKDNPVDWYAWGDEPWQRALREKRPVLVSIGYSSCHWCHVMERESFEDEQTARLMNEHLICIKVDREERPDVDQIYMDAVVRMTGQGGWPLNAFCTPQGEPFHGGTYFPPTSMHGRPSWSEVVLAISRVWTEQPQQVEEQAQRVMQALGATPDVEGEAAIGVATLGQLCSELMERADRQHGGFGGAPKFPTPTNLEAILAASSLHVARAGALEHLLLSLKRMARGGIYDQLGGGFHRYSTDARWLVPHFEKMLYDNGQLLRVYAEAYRQTRDPELLWPVEETVDWLEREMRDPAGGFFASQDADSEGEEGRFFVWAPQEIQAVLGDAGAEFCQAYDVSTAGNFESSGKSVLSHVLAGERDRMRPQRQQLLAARQKRVAPETDRKQICAWIGYTIGGLASAGAAHGRKDWVGAASRAADFALRELSDGGTSFGAFTGRRELRSRPFSTTTRP